ncbi:hypothetical protein BST61_g1372 [Cercospora zeina]
MAVPTRPEYITQLAHEDCDICYEPMTQPTRTSCRHFYCLQCLQMWLKANNTCPTCRTKLFDEVDVDDEEEHNEAAPATIGGVDAVEQERSTPQPAATEAAIEIIVNESQNPIEVQHEEEVIRRRLEVSLSGIFRIPAPISFDRAFIRRLLLRLQTNGHALPEWFADMDQWDVLYSFQVNANASAWMFQYIEFSDPRGFAGDRSDEWEAVIASHRRWTQRVSDYFRTVGPSGLSREVRQLKAEQGRFRHRLRVLIAHGRVYA